MWINTERFFGGRYAVVHIRGRVLQQTGFLAAIKESQDSPEQMAKAIETFIAQRDPGLDGVIVVAIQLDLFSGALAAGCSHKSFSRNKPNERPPVIELLADDEVREKDGSVLIRARARREGGAR